MTDRVIVYSGAIPLETDVLRTNKYAMMAVAKLAAAMLGTSTVVNGLACIPTAPAGLTVNVNAGEIYSLVNVDSTAYSSVAADTAHQIMKQGVSLDVVNLSCPAPATGGQSINYLIQATYQDSDTDNVALPYYNASNPTQAWSGPNNTGTAQSTTRKGIVVLSAKAGTAATTGSQVTPAPDAGYTGLWVVTVANGQTQITAGNITQYAGAPILPSSLLSSIQNGNLSYAVATGTANAHVVALTPALTARVDGMVIRYKAPAANTGALTLNDGLGAVSVVGGAQAALQGGETAINGDVWVQWNSSVGGGSYVMLDSSGGALQIAPATASQHAVQLGQVAGVVGSARNVKMSVTAASASATLTADEIIVETALGGLRYCLANFNKTINLATTGAGGMDTGSAPVSGYVALYAIYNPTSATSALLATNATSAVAPNVYGGANMPSGYTASALVSVWPTNGSGQFVVGYQRDRRISFVQITVLTTSVISSVWSNFSIAGAVPANAVRCGGQLGIANTSISNVSFQFATDTNGLNYVLRAEQIPAAVSDFSNFEIDILTPQNGYFKNGNSAGTPTYTVNIGNYIF